MRNTSLKPTACPPLTCLVQPINRIQGQYAAWYMMAAINKKSIAQIQTLFPLQYWILGKKAIGRYLFQSWLTFKYKEQETES